MPDETPNSAPSPISPSPASEDKPGIPATKTPAPPVDKAPQNAPAATTSGSGLGAANTLDAVKAAAANIAPTPVQDPQGGVNDTAALDAADARASEAKLSEVPAKPAEEPIWEPNHLTTPDNANDLIHVVRLLNGVAGRAWRGVCRKCGWQTHQGTKPDALDAVASHVVRHVAPVPAETDTETPVAA